MKKYSYIMAACCSFILAACGSSSNQGAPTLPVDEQLQSESEQFNNFCFNFPENAACQQTNQNGSSTDWGNYGFQDYDYNQGGYFNGQSQYGDNHYGNMCGCQSGYQVVAMIIEGQQRMMCERITGVRTTGIEVVFSFRSSTSSNDNHGHGRNRGEGRRNRGDRWNRGQSGSGVDMDFEIIGYDSTVMQQEFQNPNGNCQVSAPTRCIPQQYGGYQYGNQCQGIPDSYGNYINAVCQAIPGQQYGECVPANGY